VKTVKDIAEESLVRPVVSPQTPRLGPFAVIAGVVPDHQLIHERVAGEGTVERPLYLGRILTGIGNAGSTLAGPVLGAPQAVMTLETLLAWGARSVLFFGWCGSIAEHVGIGDVVVPDGAFCDEGTSPHYGVAPGQAVPVSAVSPLPDPIRPALERAGVPVHAGKVWTTDAIFRETPSRVKRFRGHGAVAVDMEIAALMSVAAFRGATLSCVLVVSDALKGDDWKKGFTDPRFKDHRRQLCWRIADTLLAPGTTL
jgi:uridine phosphorylase